MAGIAAGIGLGLLGGATNVYAQQKQAEADAAAAEDAYNNYLQTQSLRESGANSLASLYDLTRPEYLGYSVTDPTTGQQVPAYTTGQTDLGKAVSGIGTAADNAFALQSQGVQNALGNLYAAPGASSQALNQYGQAAQGLSGSYLQQAGEALRPGLNATSAYDARQAGWQTDPGYEFRRKQGEDAIMRAASASGGRLSGNTLQALVGYNQDLASQEYGNIANRNIGLLGQEQAAGGQLAGLYGGAGQQLAGLYGGYGSQLAGQIGQTAQDAAQMQLGGYSQLAGLENQGAGNQLAALMNVTGAKVNTKALGLPSGAPPVMPAPQSGAPYAAAGNALTNLGSNLAFYGMQQEPSPYETYQNNTSNK